MTEILAATEHRQRAAGDIRLVALVSAAHGLSHFFGLVLPPIFPLLTGAFGVGYTELGLLVALMSVASGLMQTPAGILVDRLGAGIVLSAGLGLVSGATLLFGLAPGFWWLLPLAIAAGLGQSAFHPADYAIMTAQVDAGRLGRAYSAHSVAGNIGWVAAPVCVLGLTALFGWRAGLVILGAAGLLFTLYLVAQRAVMTDRRVPAATVNAGTVGENSAARQDTRVLLSPPILMCFVYFTLLSVALAGWQTFLPSAAIAAFGISIAAANLLLTAVLLAASLGVVAGGLLADRFARHEFVVAVTLAAAAVLTLLLGVTTLPLAVLVGCAVLVGLALGGAGPARDMLVRGAAPEGGTGKVFGFVYSGLDLGVVISSPLLGFVLDQGLPRLVFAVSAIALLGAIVAAIGVVARQS